MDLTIYRDQMDRVHERFSREEERELAIQSRAGDSAAREKLIASIMPMVIGIAQRFEGRGLDLDDLIQHGNLGAMKAVDRFDVHRGCRLTTYATWWIRQAIRGAVFAEGSMIKIPIHVFGKKHQEKMSPKQRQAISMLRKVRSLSGSRRDCGSDYWSDSEIAGRGESELYEKISRLEQLGQFNQAFSRLNDRHRRVLEMRMNRMTLLQVGEVLGVCKERVRQIEVEAKAKLEAALVRRGRRELAIA